MDESGEPVKQDMIEMTFGDLEVPTHQNESRMTAMFGEID
jgi:hypothetical protein